MKCFNSDNFGEKSIFMFSDDLIRGKQINVNQENERRYWAGLLGCKESDLMQAVLKVGNSAVSVEAYLSMNCLMADRGRR